LPNDKKKCKYYQRLIHYEKDRSCTAASVTVKDSEYIRLSFLTSSRRSSEEKCSYYSFYDIELLRKQLLFKEGEITYPDRQNKGKRKTRSISEIVKRESIRPKHGALLFRLANYFKSKNILQIGTTMGLSTLYLTSYATGLRCIALENVPEFATIARQAFAKEGRNPIDLRIGNYKDLLPQALNDINSLDFVFFNTLYEQHNNLWLFNECMRYAPQRHGIRF